MEIGLNQEYYSHKLMDPCYLKTEKRHILNYMKKHEFMFDAYLNNKPTVSNKITKDCVALDPSIPEVKV